MYLHKIKISTCVALLLLIPIILSSCKNRHLSRPLLNFTELYEAGNINNLTLTVYFKRTFTTHSLWSVDVLTTMPLYDDALVDKFVIRNVNFAEHANLLKQLDTMRLTQVEKESQIHAILHYVFAVGDSTFTVSGWGHENSLFVNGVEVKEMAIFYGAILPFVPDHVAERLERRIERLES